MQSVSVDMVGGPLDSVAPPGVMTVEHLLHLQAVLVSRNVELTRQVQVLQEKLKKARRRRRGRRRRKKDAMKVEQKDNVFVPEKIVTNPQKLKRRRVKRMEWLLFDPCQSREHLEPSTIERWRMQELEKDLYGWKHKSRERSRRLVPPSQFERAKQHLETVFHERLAAAYLCAEVSTKLMANLMQTKFRVQNVERTGSFVLKYARRMCQMDAAAALQVFVDVMPRCGLCSHRMVSRIDETLYDYMSYCEEKLRRFNITVEEGRKRVQWASTKRRYRKKLQKKKKRRPVDEYAQMWIAELESILREAGSHELFNME